LRLSGVAHAAAGTMSARGRRGRLSTGEAWELSQFVDTFICALQAGDFEFRLGRLESVHGLAR
jgi:hypothetical protein